MGAGAAGDLGGKASGRLGIAPAGVDFGDGQKGLELAGGEVGFGRLLACLVQPAKS